MIGYNTGFLVIAALTSTVTRYNSASPLPFATLDPADHPTLLPFCHSAILPFCLTCRFFRFATGSGCFADALSFPGLL